MRYIGGLLHWSVGRWLFYLECDELFRDICACTLHTLFDSAKHTNRERHHRKKGKIETKERGCRRVAHGISSFGSQVHKRHKHTKWGLANDPVRNERVAVPAASYCPSHRGSHRGSHTEPVITLSSKQPALLHVTESSPQSSFLLIVSSFSNLNKVKLHEQYRLLVRRCRA